ncbi:hypothetical protein SNOG_14849 [Parastagonospora nodorum SN15]|uniref:BTB domain-containing protein n=2 Tax=Phaeosphaeria nodorum (strain SN15 / ATCC MYA-4574 / FGSC 10173) TaxID=321614 RepID=Q0TZZ6_PHANO|nr:hypothetical protein SNOG_14849 [Parastagonospora nodorum SN15]EAT77701.2 hypothetical protein SNOG_14849 [Parastagonospora nodorum SN15]
MADNVRDELAGTLKSILDTGKYSDLIITCKGNTYNVHKSIVCARSGFFERAENFPGKESSEGKIDLPEDEPAVVNLLIQYLYGGEYDPKLPDGGCSAEVTEIQYTGDRDSYYHYKFPHTCGSNGCAARNSPDGNAEQLLLHAKMYEIGDKYDVIGLKQLAREKFLRASAKYWDSKHFAPAAHYAFSTTPEDDKGLRNAISNIVSQHMGLLNKPAVEALLTEFNGLAVGTHAMAATFSGQLLTSVDNLLNSGEYSDLTIICGDETHKVHKAIVCSRCDFFERAERFPVGREAAEGTINLPEDEPKIIALLLEFLYTGEYTPKLIGQIVPSFPHSCFNTCKKVLCLHHACSWHCQCRCRNFTCASCPPETRQPVPGTLQGGEDQLLLHAKLYSLADKYNVQGLQDLAKLKFDCASKVFWMSSVFGSVAEHVFTSTPDKDVGLRSIVKKTLVENRLPLMKQPTIQTFLMKRPEMMLELLKQ